ncbi:MAG: DUF1905 domain-containing protein [Lachnospiraceae bacterium]|nr:DUF1905 domain-containing protein [Lachnospiraceae bacterium]
MRFIFHQKINKIDNAYQLNIPFNVWEVCRKRDIITAEITIEGRIIECNLLPASNGKYKIKLGEDDLGHINLDQEHEILLYISESLNNFVKDSPYNLENPIRKITSLEVINQPVDGLCSQTCIAMLAGVTIGEVVSIMGLREWQARMLEMIQALNYYGIGHSGTVIYTQGRPVTLPKCCIMMEKMGLYCHYLVYYDGKFYDPNLPVFEEYDMGKLLGYLEVKAE